MFPRRSPPLPKAPTAAAPAGVAADGGELVYEVECALDPDAVAEFDAWLPGHVRDVLRSPGFLRAETLRAAEPAADGKVRRINRYRVQDRASLDHYLEQLAPTLREDGARRFAGRASYQRRVYASEGAYLPSSAAEEAACANCATPLHGRYCAECGQLARESARSLGTLFHDAWHVLTHIDGRFWQTLRRLAFSPGVLTNEYFAERRARYIPPFRLYIVVSLIFFSLASVSSLFDADTPIRLDGEGDRERSVAELRHDAAGGDPEPGRGFDPGRCVELDVEPAWFARLAGPTLRAACVRASQDGGRSLLAAINSNIPKLMFVFLPLMAAVMLLLYWFPRRYYVEHLVFFLHVHAALFLLFATVIVIGMLANLVPPLESLVALAGLAAFFYGVWYVWRAMRVHYRNGRLLTLAKVGVLCVAYVACLSLTLAGTALLSAIGAA